MDYVNHKMNILIFPYQYLDKKGLGFIQIVHQNNLDILKRQGWYMSYFYKPQSQQATCFLGVG